MTVRLKDVAAKAGVSVGAAQQVLAGRGDRFRKETQQRVMDAAQALGYKPDVNAMALKTGRSYLIGVLLSSVNYVEFNGFYEGIQSRLMESEYSPIYFTHTGTEEEADFLQRCVDRRVDGLIINTAVEVEAKKHTRDVAIKGIPVVEVFGRFLKNVPSIENNDHEAGQIAAKELVEAGCERICLFIHEGYNRYRKHAAPYFNAWNFYRGCKEVAKENRIPFSVKTHTVSTEPEETYQAAATAVESWAKPSGSKTGFCCFGIEQGRALVTRMGNLNWIPETEVSTVVYGDPRSFSDRPKWVSMVRPSVHDVGRTAAEVLFNMIEGKEFESTVIPPSLVRVITKESEK